jgi:hypothetical protein
VKSRRGVEDKETAIQRESRTDMRGASEKVEMESLRALVRPLLHGDE